MVVDVESRAAESMMGGKVAARACDACTRRSRASWYCPADDAFLCQSCDASIHSANHLSKRHERVQLQSSSTLPELMTATRDKTTSVWYEGFRRKARTPRNKLSQIKDVNNSNDPLVPELGVEEEEDGFFSFSSTDENEESLNCCVPVFDTFSDMVIDDIESFGLVPDGVNSSANGEELGELEREMMGNEGLIEFLPLDMDLGELTMDVESLLEEEEPCLGVKELNSIGVIKEENNVGVEINSKELKRVKDEEEEEAKCVNGGSRDSDREASKDEDRKMSLFLRLDYESVISAWDNPGSPWKTGIKPEFNLGDWRECLLGGNTCPSHVMGVFEELATAVGSVTRQQGRDGGGSDGEREAKVLRYREKRRTRLFAKKIRYEVRKLNAEQRPRIKDTVQRQYYGNDRVRSNPGFVENLGSRAIHVVSG